MTHHILVLDPPGDVLRPLLRGIRTAAGADAVVHRVDTAAQLLTTMQSGSTYDIVVIDTELGDGASDPLVVVHDVRAFDAHLPIIATADRADAASAARAIDAGATDLLVRGPQLPARVETLMRKVRRFLDLRDDNRRLTERLSDRHRILGSSPPIRSLVRRLDAVAAIPRPVLIIGERGTGKELVAWNLHAKAGPPGRPMVCVNCSAFSEALLEAELFGHERGAYTGADDRVKGCFEQADGGTLFLDEIGAMPLGFQQKILRVVEYGLFRRVGGAEDVRTTARIVAATNVDLRARIDAGTFLPDLYDRLAFEVLEVPPLRERGDDVRRLATAFLDQFADEVPAVAHATVSDDAWRALTEHDWPGNVRELKHVIERAAYRHVDGVIDTVDLGLPAARAPRRAGTGFKEQVAAFKADLLQTALAAEDGNQAAAARRLGLTYDQFRYHLRVTSPD